MTALRLVTGVPNGTPVDSDIEAFNRWSTELRGLRPNTVRVRGDLLARLQVHLGKPLRDATEQDLLQWEQTAVAGRAAETRRAYVSHARAFYRWAVASRIIAADPSSRLTNPKLHRPLPRPVADDVLRRAVEQARPKMRLMILLGAFCGLRCRRSPDCTGRTCGRRPWATHRYWSAKARAGWAVKSRPLRSKNRLRDRDSPLGSICAASSP